ncbi:hypothetical protein N8072_00865 [bacterium]|nr:hypothetical protein [bacterium]MDB4128754.1 hypothetical protein [bacterium]MDC1257211.1 hypothetical protein [bacterium]
MSTQTQDSYQIITLVDITNTKCTNPKGNSLEYKQQQNLNSFLQTLSMRAQPLNISVTQQNDPHLGDCWILQFDCDISKAWNSGDNPIHYINSDLHNIPVTLGEQCIDTGNNTYNTYVKIV